MRTLLWAEVEAQATDRPEGYLEAIRAVGIMAGPVVRISEADFERIRAQFPGPNGPSLLEMTQNFVGAAKRWAKAGCRVVSQEQFERRLAACRGCPNWSTDGVLARCAICGCFRLKLWAASERCPVAKWGVQEPCGEDASGAQDG